MTQGKEQRQPCPACGHDDPHLKNGPYCGADVEYGKDGLPPYFLQCACEAPTGGSPGPRIVEEWIPK